MNHRDIAVLMDGIAPVLRGYVEKAFEPIGARILEIEKRFDALPAPRDGKDADPVLILRLVEETVAKLPPAQAGADGKDADPVLVAELVDKAVAALEPAKDGEPGTPGESVTVEHLAPMVAETVAKAVSDELEKIAANLPAGKDGAPGEPGKSVTVEDVAPLIAEQIGDAVAAIRVPEDGKSITVDDVRPLLEEMVTSGFEAFPKLPTSFMVNEAGELAAVYAAGEIRLIGHVRGEDGARGASVMDGDVDDEGVLVLRMSDGRTVKAGLVRGAPGAPGENGQAGARGREALEVKILPGIDESRSYAEGICARWRGGVIRSERQTDAVVDGDVVAAGWGVLLEGIAEEVETPVDEGRVIERVTTYTSGRSYSRTVKTATPLDRGVWKDDGPYTKGDGVTWSGSWFIAQRDTAPGEKPQNSDAWRLAIKRGRDGADGKMVAPKTGPVKI
jgi:hypothetical protein